MVKISLVSGFLGAGKTTFIKKMLGEGFFGKTPLLVENDYGSLGIDSQVMAALGVRVKEMTAGCICCSLVGNFVIELEELIRKQQPEHIIIEPSGVGKLSEVRAALRELGVPYEEYLAVTIVDAGRFDQNDQYVREYFWDQIQSADAVILSKTAGLSGQELLHICSAIRKNAPAKKTIYLPWEKDYTPLLQEISGAQPSVISTKTHMRPGDKPRKKTALRYSFSGVEERREGSFGSWSIQTDRVYTGSQLAGLLMQLDDPKRCGKVIRAKGFLKTTEGGVLLDYVPEHGKLTPASCENGRLLIIGTGLDHRALDEMFG